MFDRTLPLLVATLALVAGLCWATTGADADARSALAEAVKRGGELYKKPWKAGAKTCAACHTRGPNKMTAKRAQAYPKYDKVLKKVVTLQQKLNQMIESKSKGKALELGSDDLNALEAYLKSLK